MHSSQSHKCKPHIHRLSNKFAHSVITLCYCIIFKWYQHLSWFVFLPMLKTKKLGANSVFASDPGELWKMGKEESQHSLKKSICQQITVGHWDSVPLDTTECSLCEWRIWGSCLPTISVFMFAWSPGLFSQLVPQAPMDSRCPQAKRGRKALGRGTICSDVGGHFMSQFVLFVLYL